LQKYRVQRQFERHILSVPVNITRKAPQKAAHYSQRVPGLTMEISEGGLSAMLTEAFKIGEAVEVSFQLPSAGRVTVDATVRNKNLFRYGFEFDSVSEEARQRIIKACESLPPYEGGW
jgi:c-di-GMP-binding flagellar brake protein YcgR